MVVYYLDTAIFIDYYENRVDKFRPLGDWAHRLLALIEIKKDTLLISDFLIAELETHFSEKDTKKILETFQGLIRKIEFNEEQAKEAKQISKQRGVPFGDALHAIIARDNNAVMVTRDKHFEELKDIAKLRKPEDLI